MKIIEVPFSDSSLIHSFIQFPFELYEGNHLWVPPFISDMKLVFDRKKHPFYKHSDARFFLAVENGRTIGRLAAIHNTNYASYHQEAVGFFYYFECINDLNTARKLFDAAKEWFLSRGVGKIIGPKGFLRSNGFGILVEGFEYLPAVGIPYNQSYYDDLLEKVGFNKLTDYYSGYLYAKNKLPEKLHQVANKVKEKGDYWVKRFRNKKEMEPWIEKVDQVHFKAFHNNPEYYPSTPEEFKLMANNIRQIADPDMIKLIMKGENLAGFVISYANISQAIQKTKGRLLPFGWLTIKKAMQDRTLVDINGVGLLPDYQGRGANAVLYTELEKTLRSLNIVQAELVQIDQRNFLSKSDMEMLGVEWCKTHRTYKLEIT